MLTRIQGQLSGYAAEGKVVVWSAAAPAADRRVYLHDVTSGTSTAISQGPAAFPVLAGQDVLWTDEPAPESFAASRWALQRYRIDTGASTTVVAGSEAPVRAWGIGRDRLVFSADNDPGQGKRELYESAAVGSSPSTMALPLDTAASSTASTGTLATCTSPLSCGQVRKSGYYLYDNAGRWKVNGVQFFLPRYGINSWTFHDANYSAGYTSIGRWLDIARDQLKAKTLRIFIDLPSGGSTPTQPATIYDFAKRANARGMRVGVVMQNSSDFNMTTERRNWINSFITYFNNKNAKSLIAYVSAANEINNWCGGKDCYDNNPSYVDAANSWVSRFNGIFKNSNSGILTTVGLSTEVQDLDGKPATYDFYRPDRYGRKLASLVDFISPHNYGGGGYGISHQLRYELGYQRPIVLEEYGFPTDPKAANSMFAEGPIGCRDSPLDAACVSTAPYFVEINAKSIREVQYAGGVAWMIGDIDSKQCGSSPPDLWTGLVASGWGYCGGTYTTTSGQLKATGYRVKLHHTYY